MPKAYSYLRFSTPDQATGDSQRRQLQAAKNYAQTHGLELDDSLSIRDEGVSSFRGKNLTPESALGAFLESVKAGDVPAGSFLLVENLDRISRQTARKAARALESLCDAGVTVVTLTDGKQYTAKSLDSDPLAFIYIVLGFTRAHEESALKSRRIKEAWKGRRIRAKKDKRPIGGVCPAWLTLDTKTQTYKAIPERARVVKRLFRDTLRGVGQHALAHSLNSEGVPVFGRAKYWHRSYVSKILSSRAVLGELAAHTMEDKDGKVQRVPSETETVKRYYPAVVSAEDFRRVQELIKKSGAPLRGRHVSAGVFNLFGSVARCGRCNGAAVLVNKGKPPKGGRYLVCAAAKTGAGCQYETARYDRLENAFLTHADETLAVIPAGGLTGAKLDTSIRSAEASLDEHERLIRNLLRAIEKGATTVAAATRLREAEAERDTLKAGLEALRSRRETVNGKNLTQRAHELRSVLLEKKPLDRAHANALVRQLFEAVSIDFDRLELDLIWKHDAVTTLAYGMKTAKRKHK